MNTSNRVFSVSELIDLLKEATWKVSLKALVSKFAGDRAMKKMLGVIR